MSVRLASNVQGEKADKILNRAERALLSVRIGQTVKKLDNLTQKQEKLKRDVWAKLPTKRAEIEVFVNFAQVQKHADVEIHQQNKFKIILDTKLKKNGNLVESKDTLTQECFSKWVKNCSNHILSDSELSVLKKGLNFAVT